MAKKKAAKKENGEEEDFTEEVREETDEDAQEVVPKDKDRFHESAAGTVQEGRGHGGRDHGLEESERRRDRLWNSNGSNVHQPRWQESRLRSEGRTGTSEAKVAVQVEKAERRKVVAEEEKGQTQHALGIAPAKI
jgi:hypothetical protein